MRVNLVRPGLVQSPLWSAMGEAERDELYQATAVCAFVGGVSAVHAPAGPERTYGKEKVYGSIL